MQVPLVFSGLHGRRSPHAAAAGPGIWGGAGGGCGPRSPNARLSSVGSLSGKHHAAETELHHNWAKDDVTLYLATSGNVIRSNDKSEAAIIKTNRGIH